MTENDFSVTLWCIENNGDPEHCWWANMLILHQFNPRTWFYFATIVASELQYKMEMLGVSTEKLIWQIGHGPPLPLDPKYFDKRKFN